MWHTSQKFMPSGPSFVLWSKQRIMRNERVLPKPRFKPKIHQSRVHWFHHSTPSQTWNTFTNHQQQWIMMATCINQNMLIYLSRFQGVPDEVTQFVIRHFPTQVLHQLGRPHQYFLGDTQNCQSGRGAHHNINTTWEQPLKMHQTVLHYIPQQA